MLVEAIPTVGKNTQQIRAAILKQVKAYEKLLNAFCGSARVEASLIVHVQVRSLPLCLACAVAPFTCWCVPLQGSDQRSTQARLFELGLFVSSLIDTVAGHLRGHCRGV